MLSPLEEKIIQLGKLLAEIQEEVAPINSNLEQFDLAMITGYVMLLKDLKDHGNDLAKVANISLPGASERGVKCMDAAGMSSGDIEHNGRMYRITPEVKIHASVNKENKPAFIQWMKQHERGRECVKEDVHPATILSFVTSEMNEYGQDKPPFVSMMLEPALNVRKLPGKKV